MQDIEIEDTKEYKTAFSSSLRYLTYRARTKKEIINYLTKKGYQDNIIHKIVNKLIDINYINDDEFVINFIYNSMNNQSKGRLSITNELLEKGISEEIINRHIHLYSEDKEIAIANTIACKFFYNNSHLPMKQIKNKLYNRLMRRGFSKNSIDSVFQFLNNDSKVQALISAQTENYEKQAYQLAEKYYNKYSKNEINIFKIKQKIYNQLVRRGYDFDICNSVIEKIIR